MAAPTRCKDAYPGLELRDRQVYIECSCCRLGGNFFDNKYYHRTTAGV